MALLGRFWSAVAEAGADRVDRVSELPMLLARACVLVLPVAGAGVSLTHQLRVPLGFSDEVASRAEQLQVTLGDGPCLTASATGVPLAAGTVEMGSRWPLFAARLAEQTPYRSIASLPLRAPDQPSEWVGALDLYLTVPSPQLPPLDVLAREIAAPTATALFGSPPTMERSGVLVPVWLRGEASNSRMDVWVAVGMLSGHAGLSGTDALAVLRGYAFSHTLTVDQVAAQMMTHNLTPQTVLDTTQTR